MAENEQSTKGLSKKVIAIMITGILIIGGAVAAFVFIAGSPKTDYFKAEKNTADFLSEKVEERYQPEFDWAETAKEHPTENTVELSAQYNGPQFSGPGMGPEQIINNSTVTMTSQVNQDDKQLATDLNVSFGGMEVDGIKLFADSDHAFLQLPFLEEVLTIKDSDLNKMLQEMDPAFEDADIDFESLFNQMDSILSEENRTYLIDEYPKMVLDELPEDSFETENETVKVEGESVEAEKITVNLTEQQLKDLITKVLEKAKDDEQLKEIIEKQMKNQFGMFAAESLSGEIESEIDKTMENFDQTIDQMIDGVEDFQIPDGLTSAIWVKDNLIVKRDFSISMAPEGEELSTLSITGDQMLNDSTQDLAYELSIDDSTASVDMNLSNEDNSLEDSITISGGDMELSYDGESTLEDGTREFDRTFSLSTPEPNGSGSLNWSGEATYDNDRKEAQHTLSVKMPNVPQDIVSLSIQNDAKTIKEVDQPDDSNVKDLGDMSVQELSMYFQTDVAGKFQQWLMNLMGTPGGGSSF